MGKTVNYHPVSLHVLRGALAYGGFTVGKFTQHNSNPDLGYASYQTEIKTWPAKLDQVSPELLRVHLNNCFAADVEFVAVWVTRTGKRVARLQTQVIPMPARAIEGKPDIRRYEDLSDAEKADIPF